VLTVGSRVEPTDRTHPCAGSHPTQRLTFQTTFLSNSRSYIWFVRVTNEKWWAVGDRQTFSSSRITGQLEECALDGRLSEPTGRWHLKSNRGMTTSFKDWGNSRRLSHGYHTAALVTSLRRAKRVDRAGVDSRKSTRSNHDVSCRLQQSSFHPVGPTDSPSYDGGATSQKQRA
jgi:hypothetical protein